MSDIEEGRVERLVAGGAGLLRREGPPCFVRGVLPGERIRYKILGKRRGAVTGELVELLEPSPRRVSPPCPYYGECGGCEIQEIAYQEQLRLKREILLEQMKRIGGIPNPKVEVTRSGAAYGSRTRLRLHREDSGSYGFRRRRSREIVPVERCMVASEAVNRELGRLRAEKAKAREIVLAEHDRGVARSDRPEAVRVTLLRRGVWFSGAGFFQSNLSMFEGLLRELLRLAASELQREGTGGSYTLYDLYAGTGAIAAVTAAGLRERAGAAPEAVHCVEPDGASARFVSQNLEEFSHTLHEEPVERFLSDRKPPEREAIIVADPPRAGLSTAVREWLLRGGPRTLFYVSCDPATFARDLALLSGRYTAERVIPFDFFPQTAHVETLCLLRPKEKS
ncbi:MAG: class I SAM-dependent RNA methyltransferase [Spirochaetaceae bacterium]